jgi:hypothetical protein
MSMQEVSNVLRAVCLYCDDPITRNDTAVLVPTGTRFGSLAHGDCALVQADLAFLREACERELFPIREA